MGTSLGLKKIAFIGGGNMCEAIVKGIIASSLVDPKTIFIGEKNEARAKYMAETYGVNASGDNKEAVKGADLVVLAVKPQVVDAALTKDLAAAVPKKAFVLSIMGSVTIAKISGIFKGHHIIRTMPNTPLAVGEGMTAVAPGEGVTDKELDIAVRIFSSCGEAVVVTEKDIDAVTAVSGCGPGYAFILIDALADAAVMAGLPRATAVKLAAQTFKGAGKMVLETKKHPDELRDGVTSPGGTTIAGIRAMEKCGARSAMYAAVEAALKRNEELKGN